MGEWREGGREEGRGGRGGGRDVWCRMLMRGKEGGDAGTRCEGRGGGGVCAARQQRGEKTGAGKEGGREGVRHERLEKEEVG